MNESTSNVKKVTMAGILVAVAVVGSTFSFPVGISKCAPVQHMINILCAVLLGRYYGVGVAFCASTLRLVTGLGSVLAFPGSMWGALLAGIVYNRTGNLFLTLLAEVFGTGILGGLSAYPLAIIVWVIGRSNCVLYLCGSFFDFYHRWLPIGRDFALYITQHRSLSAIKTASVA